MPHSRVIDAVFIKLMHKFVGIFLSKSIFELLFILRVDQVCVLSANFPLSPWAELLYSWEAPRSVGIVFGDVLVSSKLHLKVKLSLIWLSEITSLLNQVLVLTAVSGVVKVNDARGKV